MGPPHLEFARLGGGANVWSTEIVMTGDSVNAQVDVLAVVIEIMQTDLKLGDMPLNRDTQLVGGDLGLDSLDLLMLVTGVEKKLDMKIPNDQLGQETMETIGLFVDFIEQQRSSA